MGSIRQVLMKTVHALAGTNSYLTVAKKSLTQLPNSRFTLLASVAYHQLILSNFTFRSSNVSSRFIIAGQNFSDCFVFLLNKKKGQHTFYKVIYFISISRRFPGPPALYSGITQIIDEDIVITWSLYRHLCRGYHSLTKWTHCCQAITHSKA